MAKIYDLAQKHVVSIMLEVESIFTIGRKPIIHKPRLYQNLQFC